MSWISGAWVTLCMELGVPGLHKSGRAPKVSPEVTQNSPYMKFWDSRAQDLGHLGATTIYTARLRVEANTSNRSWKDSRGGTSHGEIKTISPPQLKEKALKHQRTFHKQGLGWRVSGAYLNPARFSLFVLGRTSGLELLLGLSQLETKL